MASDLAMWCFAEPDQWTDGQVELSEEELRHAHQVMRLEDGASVHVLDGQGKVGMGPLRIASKKAGFVEIESSWVQEKPPLHATTLAAALCKPARWEWMLEKAAELGLGALAPIQSHRTIVKAGSKEDIKIRKWQNIFIRACKQSHNAWLPDIHPIGSLKDWLENDPPEIILTGALTEDAKNLETVLPDLPLLESTCGIALGPEGDFDDEEYQALRNHGALMLDFGPRILRCETAALYVLSSLMYERQRQNHA